MHRSTPLNFWLVGTIKESGNESPHQGEPGGGNSTDGLSKSMAREKTTDNGRIGTVLFDFGGVIAEEGFKQGLSHLAKERGLEEQSFLAAAFDATYSTGYVLGRGTEGQFWEEVRRKTGLSGPEVSLWDDIYPRFTIRSWMLSLIDKLRTKGLRVGILSDQTDMLDRLNDKHDFFRRFDYVFNSYHLNKGKRDISLFDDIAAILHSEPERLLFIDDHPGHVERARQKGWQALLYSDRESLERELARMLPRCGEEGPPAG